MALVFGAAAAACSFGVVDCDFSSEGSYPTVDIDQCEEADKQLKEEYGDDYLTNRTTMPVTSYGLQYIKSIGCETTFGYDTLANEFCQSLENYDTQIGGGQSSLNVNTLTSGVVYVAGNSISTTTGVGINVKSKMNFTGGIDGSPVALGFFMQK